MRIRQVSRCNVDLDGELSQSPIFIFQTVKLYIGRTRTNVVSPAPNGRSRAAWLRAGGERVWLDDDDDDDDDESAL